MFKDAIFVEIIQLQALVGKPLRQDFSSHVATGVGVRYMYAYIAGSDG